MKEKKGAPKGAGNFSDVSRHAKPPGDNKLWLDGYDDTFPATAPVMSFEPNKVGLYDPGGNVWEWVENWYDIAKKTHVLRCGSWTYCERGDLLSSNRNRNAPDNQILSSSGFRVVLVVSASGQ